MKSREVDPRPGTSAARRAMKSRGWNTTWVVPSRYGVFSAAANGQKGTLRGLKVMRNYKNAGGNMKR
jgi:hypothetical protein